MLPGWRYGIVTKVPFKDVLVDGVPLYTHQCAYKCTKGCSADTAKDVTGKDGVKYSVPRGWLPFALYYIGLFGDDDHEN